MTEIETLHKKVTEAKNRTEVILKDRYGENRSLQFLPVHRRRTLFNLFVWSDRYHLPLESILIILFEHYDKLTRSKKKLKSQRGLPVRVETLLGEHSERILRAYVKDQFPNREHILLEKQNGQDRQIQAKLEQDNLIQKTKSLEGFTSIQAWMVDYTKRMSRIQQDIATIRDYFGSNTKPYRGNPWR